MMDQHIRVRTDDKYGRLYNDLKNVAVGDFHELFFVCACLGYQQAQARPLTGSGEARFWSSTIEPREWTCYYAMVLAENGMDYEAIQDDKAVLSCVEQYANGGMEVLLEAFLSEHTTEQGDQLQLAAAGSKELSRDLLHFLYERTDPQAVGGQ